jgi:hypothetical protein
MWNMKCMIIPVIIRATGISTNGLKKDVKNMLGKYLTDSLQKTSLFITSYIKRKILQFETGSLGGGSSRCFKRSTRKKRPVTRENNGIITILIIISTFKGRSGDSLQNKWDNKLKHSQYIIRWEKQLISENKYRAKKYYKQQQIGKADSVKNSMRQ